MKIRYREIRDNINKLNELGLSQDKIRSYLKQAYPKKFSLTNKDALLGFILEDYKDKRVSKEDTIKELDKLFPKLSKEDKEFIDKLELINFPSSLLTF